ncbi:hypothetical protein EV292_10388 [Sphingomonas sp. BK235]|nr:hypothetical protein EV292_10388 [Sphingomonas sp. BK235]
MKRGLAIGGLIVVAAAATWAGLGLRGGRHADSPAVSKALPAPADAPAPRASDEVSLDSQDDPVDLGATPMAQRVAVLGLLNKRNGVSRDITLRPGQAVRAGDVIVRLRACEQTAPWEPEPLTGAFVQLDVRAVEGGWRRAFSGWLYKERPNANVVIHPVYDVWTKSCAMSFPGTAPAAKPSSAPKSPTPAPTAAPTPAAEEAAPPADEAVEESAAPSRVM